MAETQTEAPAEAQRAPNEGQNSAQRPPDKSYERPKNRPDPPPYPVSRLVVRRRAVRA
jgi:hypothetical protein